MTHVKLSDSPKAVSAACGINNLSQTTKHISKAMTDCNILVLHIL